MERFRLGGLIVLSLVLVTSQFGRSDDANAKKPLARPPAPPQHPLFVPQVLSTEIVSRPAQAAEGELTCQVYSLGEWSNDPNLGKWIADTIPEVIQPGSWSAQGGKSVLRYHAATGTLVVYQSQTGHAQVDAFLKNLKKSMTQKQTATSYMPRSPGDMPKYPVVVPAKYSPADAAKEAAASKSTAYPVPAQAQQPKHLFHFIIRYEGEGIIDSTVAGVLKQLYGTEEQAEDGTPIKKKKKKSKQPADEQSSAQGLDQLFHVILRYEGEGIIDSTVAGVLKAMYAAENAPRPNFAPSSTTCSPATLPPQDSRYAPIPTTPAPPTPPAKPVEPSGTSSY